MAGQPQYPDTGEDTGTGARREPLTARQRRSRIAVIVTVAVLLLAVIVLHLAGVFGPGSGGM